LRSVVMKLLSLNVAKNTRGPRRPWIIDQ
jgi:hypothetical protein